ncbi:hypothetical protein MPDQ_006390 [Monascus purpureus]|uniref:Uncharacterized protein n=1 Tax=Monascus purpureus TaxID=5098 RepID=A0A507QUF8_MONPU|nr:hypothetical protein MPDQ_006390 [Monascus purpureus]
MGRQAYINRLALGRSPYEAPESSVPDLSTSARRRAASLCADGYVQHYDERGHPINPESKQFGRELRRAKNDILSTMGVVVSGEDGNSGISNEQRKINLIAAENDYGLFVATLDQILVFIGSWWTSSLAGRVQTFRSYTQVPLANIIRFECASVGLPGFYFAGIPAWAISSCLSICRHHPLERLMLILQSPLLRRSPNDEYTRIIRSIFSILHSATRGVLLALSVQTYIYSLLQSLHLIHPYVIPGAQLFTPFGGLLLFRLPSLPRSLSLRSLSAFFSDLLKAPPLMIYLYVYLRPIIEVRLYRLIRRRLTKPSLADEHSIRVAFENDLLDWMVPTLGRRSEEENVRGRLTFFEDLKCEILVFSRWVMSWFDSSRRGSDPRARLRTRGARMESLRRHIEELQTELGAAQSQTRLSSQLPIAPSQDAGELSLHNNTSGSREHLPDFTQAPVESLFDMDQVFSNDENRMSQSPMEMEVDNEYFEMASRAVPSTTALPNESMNNGSQISDEAGVDQSNSRSNTLFSPVPSPGTSPPTSPRVRASLIHQNSDIITMQLEVLTNRNVQASSQENARASNEDPRQNHRGAPNDRRSITEFLDSLLSNQGNNLAAGHPSHVGESDGLSNFTATAPATLRGDSSIPAVENQPQDMPANNPIVESPVDAPVTSLANVLPDGVEEPNNEGIHNNQLPEGFENRSETETRPYTSRSLAHPRSTTSGIPPPAHRVTILSAHPVDSVASHAASILTTTLFIPFESLYLRSLATSYLSSRAFPSTLRYDVRPMGAWAGGGSMADAAAYMGKLAVLVGMQAAMNVGFWSIITRVVVYIGKTFCGWGTL